MQPEKARIDEARNWFIRASQDLRSAEILLQNDRTLEGVVLFHCQQAVEKTLKGFLAFHNVSFRKTHHIGVLGRQCIDIDPSLESMIRQSFKLTVFAWVFRYPEEPEEPEAGDAASSLKLAGEVFASVLEKLPGSVRP